MIITVLAIVLVIAISLVVKSRRPAPLSFIEWMDSELSAEHRALRAELYGRSDLPLEQIDALTGATYRAYRAAA